MRLRLFGLAMVALCSPASADDQRTELLQSALAICQQQTQDANAQAIQRLATMSVELAALRKRVQELEQKAEPKKP